MRAVRICPRQIAPRAGRICLRQIARAHAQTLNFDGIPDEAFHFVAGRLAIDIGGNHVIAAGGVVTAVDGGSAGDLFGVDVSHGAHVELVFAVGGGGDERVIAGGADAAFVDHARVGGRVAQEFPAIFGRHAGGELARGHPVFAVGAAAHHDGVVAIFKPARRPAGRTAAGSGTVGAGVGGPGGFGGGVGIPEPQVEPFFGDVDETVIDETRDARGAQDIAKCLAQLGRLLGLHGGVGPVDAVLGEMNLPGVWIGGIGLPEPSGEYPQVAKRDTGIVIGPKGGFGEVGRIGMVGQHPVPVAELGDETREKRLDAQFGNGIGEHGVKTGPKEVIEGDEDLGLFLLFACVVVGGVVVVGIDGDPLFGFVSASALVTPDVEP